jgi:hypothetical protein
MRDLYLIYAADVRFDVFIDVCDGYEDAITMLCGIAGLRQYQRSMTDQGELWEIDGYPGIHIVKYVIDNAY